ncbi:hypothetical protein ACJX0J_041255, partial [Zea mays]
MAVELMSYKAVLCSTNSRTCILEIDFAKAFDSVNWDSLLITGEMDFLRERPTTGRPPCLRTSVYLSLLQEHNNFTMQEITHEIKISTSLSFLIKFIIPAVSQFGHGEKKEIKKLPETFLCPSLPSCEIADLLFIFFVKKKDRA